MDMKKKSTEIFSLLMSAGSSLPSSLQFCGIKKQGKYRDSRLFTV